MNKKIVSSIVLCGLFTIITILFIQLHNEKEKSDQQNQFNESVLDNNLIHYYEVMLNVEETLSRYINNDLETESYKDLIHRDFKALYYIQKNIHDLFYMQGLDLEFQSNINKMNSAFDYLQINTSSEYTNAILHLVKQYNFELKDWFQGNYELKTTPDRLDEAIKTHNRITEEIYETHTKTRGENND